jgi:hypothetical protein
MRLVKSLFQKFIFNDKNVESVTASGGIPPNRTPSAKIAGGVGSVLDDEWERKNLWP